jgi:5-carboxymethyl-2-hydroxymuconate isomerase
VPNKKEKQPMPQITLEYTNNIDQALEFDPIFSGIHEILADVADIRVDNCKSRARRLDHYYIGAGNPNHAFLHLEAAILEGRTPEIKKELGRQILEHLQKHFSPTFEAHDLQVTVEIRDIPRAAYFKVPAGTI